MQTYDLFAPETLADPHAVHARMRAEPGLCRIAPFGAYAASRYEDVRTHYKDSQRFSSEALAEAAVRQGEVELVDAFSFALPRDIIGQMPGLAIHGPVELPVELTPA